jgi:hypothetical protein
VKQLKEQQENNSHRDLIFGKLSKLTAIHGTWLTFTALRFKREDEEIISCM